MNPIWEEMSVEIHVNTAGTIVFNPSFLAKVKQTDLDSDKLFTSIEESVFTNDDGDEEIDWDNVKTCYEGMG